MNMDIVNIKQDEVDKIADVLKKYYSMKKRTFESDGCIDIQGMKICNWRGTYDIENKLNSHFSSIIYSFDTKQKTSTLQLVFNIIKTEK